MRLLFLSLLEIWNYFSQAFKSGYGFYSIRKFIYTTFLQFIQFPNVLRNEYKQLSIPHSPIIKKLHTNVSGWHKLLPPDSRFTYSILIPVYKPKPNYLKTALESALQQTAPHFEVLVGFDGLQPNEVYAVVNSLKKYPHLKSFQLDREKEGGNISATTNYLAKKAQGNYLVLMDHDDWIRPDLLFRYEQTLRLLPHPENIVLYCNEYKIDEKDRPLNRSGLEKPNQPYFPYVFVNIICHCLMIPKPYWDKVGGLCIECNGAQDYDIALRLDLAGAKLYNVPFYLYAWRSHDQSTAKNINQKDYSVQAPLKALSRYFKAKNLDWKVEHGICSGSYRALPQITKTPTVHVIIPYKDLKKYTLKTVLSVLAQKDVTLKITAIDNQSTDASIAKELEALGVEVLTIHEPFNYSRLNNLGVKNSRWSPSCEYILFLNNDVELDPGAIYEMCRWIEQPKIGMVGCRLSFPNGLLQHGGIEIHNKGPSNKINWVNTNKLRPKESIGMANFLGVTDAVTAACCLMKRSVFFEVGGFDEIWYPVAYSDTNLATKLKARGLWCFYTPYATGIHHESISRDLQNIEDVEISSWLHENYVKYQLTQRET